MNPLTQIRQIKKINESELKLGIAGEKKSWHDVYKDSAWIFVGGLNFDLTEGDVISVFSQYGEVVNMNMVRDPKTGKSRGFAFICYEDQRSTVLAVDNFNGIKLIGRTIRVDHVANYRPPKDKDETDELTRLIYERGCGPEISMEDLEKEAAKREVRRGFDRKGGEKRSFDKPWSRDKRDREQPVRREVKAEYDEDGDIRRGPPPSQVKVEYDEEGDIRRAPPPRYDEDIRPPIKREYDRDGDIVASSSKRRSVDTSRKIESPPRRHHEDRHNRRRSRSSSRERHHRY